MKRRVGLGVSQKMTAMGAVDQEGETPAESVPATAAGAITGLVRRRAPDAVRIGVESGSPAVRLGNERRERGGPASLGKSGAERKDGAPELHVHGHF